MREYDFEHFKLFQTNELKKFVNVPIPYDKYKHPLVNGIDYNSVKRTIYFEHCHRRRLLKNAFINKVVNIIKDWKITKIYRFYFRI